MTGFSSVKAPKAFFESHQRLLQLTAEDKLALMELTCRFEWSFDARRLEALEEILADDVVIDHLFGLAAGKPAAMRMLRDVVPYEGIRHQATNPVVFIDEHDRPAVLSFLMVVQVDDPRQEIVRERLPRILAHALVTDVFRKVGDTWKIAARTFEQFRTAHDYLPNEQEWRAVEQTAAERALARKASDASPD